MPDAPAPGSRRGFSLTSPVEFCIIFPLPFESWQQEEVGCVEMIVNFFVSVGAGVICYYICKWLDRHSKGS